MRTALGLLLVLVTLVAGQATKCSTEYSCDADNACEVFQAYLTCMTSWEMCDQYTLKCQQVIGDCPGWKERCGCDCTPPDPCSLSSAPCTPGPPPPPKPGCCEKQCAHDGGVCSGSCLGGMSSCVCCGSSGSSSGESWGPACTTGCDASYNGTQCTCASDEHCRTGSDFPGGLCQTVPIQTGALLLSILYVCVCCGMPIAGLAGLITLCCWLSSRGQRQQQQPAFAGQPPKYDHAYGAYVHQHGLQPSYGTLVPVPAPVAPAPDSAAL